MKRIMALVLAIIMILGCISTILFATASAKESTFTDVMGTVSEWANVYIEKMVDRGILDGIGGGKFNPEGLLTREQFAKVLVLGIPKEDKGITSEFSDVVSGSWYEEFVKKAVSTGIMKGYSKEEFGVSDSIKRCDMALGIARLDKTDEELKTYADKIPATVEDRDTIPDYAKGAMGYCYEKGIFSGDEKGNFKPFDNTTRAQIAKVICVYLENAEKEITSEITEEITSEITEEITSEPSDEITFEPTSEVSEEKEEKPSRPLITGDFIQPGLSASWSQTRWNNHFDELLEAGIDTFIIQWIAETPNGVLTTAYYPAELSGYRRI
ncbi:MAG: S-layer homology domain-containing protein [Clostridia bacterium]|nr:S-layer homology domain-containing protein [Clostridia bacterium]